MPQLQFSNPLTIGQALWMFAIFLVLYLLVKHWGLPRVTHVIALRNGRIRDDLAVAHSAKASADAAIAEMHALTRQAHADAQAQIGAAIAAAKQQAADRTAALNAMLDQRLAVAEQQIAIARSAAMGALRDVASDVGRSLLARLLGSGADATALHDHKLEPAIDRMLAAHDTAAGTN